MKKEDLSQADSASKRLKYIVDTLGVKQSHMAEKLGVSPSGLHYILNNDVKFSKNAKKIAEYLNISEEWLATGKGEVYEENTSIKTYKIPLYYPDQLKLYLYSEQQDTLNTNDYLITTTAYPNKMLGIYATETYFSAKFEVGDMIAFEQTSEFSDGEILLIYLKKTNTLTLMHGFHIENNTVFFSPDIPSIKITLNKEDIIVGRYRECSKKAT